MKSGDFNENDSMFRYYVNVLWIDYAYFKYADVISHCCCVKNNIYIYIYIIAILFVFKSRNILPLLFYSLKLIINY